MYRCDEIRNLITKEVIENQFFEVCEKYIIMTIMLIKVAKNCLQYHFNAIVAYADRILLDYEIFDRSDVFISDKAVSEEGTFA